jgi:hypothetical protein
MSKLQAINEKTKELLEFSTAHGIPNIIRSKNRFIVLMWFIFFASFVCIGSYLVMNSIFDYLKFNTVTTVSIINEHQAPFPAVSICGFPNINATLNDTIKKIRFENVYQTNITSISKYFEEFVDSHFGKCFR